MDAYVRRARGGHLRWAIARGSDPGLSNRELSNDLNCHVCFMFLNFRYTNI